MGFAGAFASGLVKGFHQNILNEQKARATEDAKLDSYEAMIFKTSMEGGENVNTSAINKISNLVKDGRKQLDSRGSIDIFGRPGKRLKLDMLNTAGIVNGTNSTYRIGSVNMPVDKDFYNTTIRADPAKRANVLFDSLNRLGPERVRELFKSKEDKLALAQVYKNNISNWLRPRVVGRNDTLVQMLGAENISINSWMKDIVGEQKNKYQFAVENLSRDGKYKQGDFILPFEKMDGVLTNFTTLGFNNKQLGSLKSLAKSHGFEDMGEFTYFAAGKYKTPETFMEGLTTTLELYDMNAQNPQTMEEMAKLGAYLTKKKLHNDPLKMANVLAPLINNTDHKLLDGLRKFGFNQALDTEDFNARFYKFTGTKLDDFNKNFKALNRSEGQVKELMRYTREAKLATGTMQSGIYKFFADIFTTTGAVDQVSNLVGVGKDDTDTKNINSRISLTIKAIEKEHGEGSLQAKIATLKFVVAADLARAEDSNGRLSDQDLARNMAKLGAGQGTIENQIAAMEVVLDDISKKRLSMFNLNKIKTDAQQRGYFTREERILISADEMGRNYIQEYNNSLDSIGMPSGPPATMKEVMNPELFSKPDSALQGSNGESVHKSTDGKKTVLVRDGIIVKEIPQEKISKAIDDGVISFLVVGGEDDVKGETSPFGNDPNPNVSQGNTNAEGRITAPAATSTTRTDSGGSVTGADLGVTNLADSVQYLERDNSNNPTGFYIINGTKYKLGTRDPLTFIPAPTN
jgi:hypothetical protein